MPMSMIAAAVVPASHPDVEMVGSSGGSIPGASSQPKIASKRSWASNGMPSLSGSSILHKVGCKLRGRFKVGYEKSGGC